MTKNDKLLAAWDQLVKTIAERQGLDDKQAVRHVRKHFPELYELYQQAKRRQQSEDSNQTP